MKDIIDIIKNVQYINENNNSLKILLDFEKVLDELNLYAFDNWIDGELVEGPKVSRYMISCTFMWPTKKSPDSHGLKILRMYGCKVSYEKNNILIPRKIKDPDDFRPGTKKGKIEAHPIWLVTIEMPKKLIHDISIGKENKEKARMSEFLKYNSIETTAETMQQGPEANEIPQTPAPAAPPANI
jgi:hypothetical protein